MADLILLHGPPASGKLTIGQALAEQIGARLFHNHLTLDVAKSVLTFGDPEFWVLVHDLRILSLQAFFKYSTEATITTWCYEDPEDYDFFMEIKSIADSANGRILPVYLNCDIKSLEARVGNAHRQEMQKLTDVDRLRTIMSQKNYRPVPDERCIELDSSNETVESNVQRIVKAFNLSVINSKN